MIVVLGATSGIGSVVLQLLHAAGAQPIAVCTAANHGFARALGATETIDYATQDVIAAIRAAHPSGIAGVIDMVGDRELNARLDS